jgi:hypothetical protein
MSSCGGTNDSFWNVTQPIRPVASRRIHVTGGTAKGELGFFFDYYVIPLAKKLKDCRVFEVVASDEYLQYAEATNRREWEVKGKNLVVQYVANYLQQEAEGPLEMCSIGRHCR